MSMYSALWMANFTLHIHYYTEFVQIKADMLQIELFYFIDQIQKFGIPIFKIFLLEF